MSKLVSATGGLAALVVIAGMTTAAPAIAQPLQIIVTDPGLIEPPPAPVPPVVPSRLLDYNLDILDITGNFDPGEAALDSQVFSVPTPAINMVRADVLEANGESIAEHQLRCQQMHASYEPASDTYLGGDGLPRLCIY